MRRRRRILRWSKEIRTWWRLRFVTLFYKKLLAKLLILLIDVCLFGTWNSDDVLSCRTAHVQLLPCLGPQSYWLGRRLSLACSDTEQDHVITGRVRLLRTVLFLTVFNMKVIFELHVDRLNKQADVTHLWKFCYILWHIRWCQHSSGGLFGWWCNRRWADVFLSKRSPPIQG